MAVMTYLEAIADGLRLAMRADPAVILLGEDVAAYGGAFKLTKGFLEEFGPRRVIDTPISEAGIVGAGIGAALVGLRPVAEMQFADFISNAFNQIVNVAATSAYRAGGCVPLVIRAPCGAGTHGGPFHSQSVEAYFFHTPGVKIVLPATPADAKGLLLSAIADPNPVLYLEHKALYRSQRGPVDEGLAFVPLGKAEVRRPGRDVTVVTYGMMVHRCLEAAEAAAQEAVQAEVIDLRTLLPLDLDTLAESIARTSRVLIVHEDRLRGGIGAEIAAYVGEHLFKVLDAPICRVGAPDSPVPYAPSLEAAYLPSVDRIRRAIVDLARW
ncbi:MAG: alpha-ketoacid dehydrogenase subunit beta [Bacillati bacterium ANGP1]|uniref:Alpha-ketoacid dehydrogenase subunit beta n=1 Tax=Candidatus Segetimicrobium genomatis TaxID=2569760 RepID=A0A537J9G6_9BACT|nr:MAG: alpha-ketoacid dehydrogenase subunit beta [Terrabacteria group bacterium ANGP1]